MFPLVENELDRLVAEGIIELVQFDQASKLDHYSIPRIEDHFKVGGW